VGDTVEFVGGEWGECHGGRGEDGEGFPGHHATAKMKIRATSYPRPNSSANRVLHPSLSPIPLRT
jgi:hypothetical protein